LLATDDHRPFEEALVTLGTLVGATDSYTYDDKVEQTKPDAVWIFGNEQWVVWEAKSRACGCREPCHVMRPAHTRG
jgi:hypothetical protein